MLTHYISTGGAAGFDHVLTAALVGGDGRPPALRASWPLYLTVPGARDALAERLRAPAAARLHTLDAAGLPATVDVRVTPALDYYHGTSDGFVGFRTVCPNLDPEAPPSATLCV